MVSDETDLDGNELYGKQSYQIWSDYIQYSDSLYEDSACNFSYSIASHVTDFHYSGPIVSSYNVDTVSGQSAIAIEANVQLAHDGSNSPGEIYVLYVEGDTLYEADYQYQERTYEISFDEPFLRRNTD